MAGRFGKFSVTAIGMGIGGYLSTLALSENNGANTKVNFCYNEVIKY